MRRSERRLAPAITVVSVAEAAASHISWGCDSRHAGNCPMVRNVNIAGFNVYSTETVLLTIDRLAYKAFLSVFQRRQTQHGALLVWLEKSLKAVYMSDGEEKRLLEGAVDMKR
jgi:hypothetical protein